MRYDREPDMSQGARWVRFLGRWVLACYLVPFAGVIGVCGLIQHYSLRFATWLRGSS